jgi:hypothetical protein
MVAHHYKRLRSQRTLFLKHLEREKQKLQAALKQKIAEKAAAEKAEAEAEASAAVRISSAEATPQKAASAASAADASAFATASGGDLAWLHNTLPGGEILSTLPEEERVLLFQKYTKARAAAALREKASREPLTDVRTTPRKCTYCSEPIMTGKRKNNTNAFWCQKHCAKNKKKHYIKNKK